jgi:hypothetical protein
MTTINLNPTLEHTSNAYTGTGNNPFIANPNCKLCEGIGYLKGYDNKICPDCQKNLNQYCCPKCKDTGIMEGGKQCVACKFHSKELENCIKCKGTGMTEMGTTCDCGSNGNKKFIYSGKNCYNCKNTGFISEGVNCKDCYNIFQLRDSNCLKCKGTGMKEKGKLCNNCLIKK